MRHRLTGLLIALPTALLAAPRLCDAAVTVLFHRTTFQDWRLCAGAPCFTSVRTPLRSRVAYLLTTRDSAVPSDARASQLLLATELTGWLQGAASVRARYGPAQACD